MSKMLEKHIIDNNKEFEILSVSTNKVQKFIYQGKEYIMKTQNICSDNLSPFWQMMRDVFESDFSAQRRNMETTCKILRNNPHIDVVKLIMTNEKDKYTVLEKMKGSSWEPDEFPDNNEICYELGKFIGYNHTHTFDCCGMPDNQNINDVKERLIRHIEKRIDNARENSSEDKRLIELYDKAKNTEYTQSRYSLIMMDISANQFLFDKNKIVSCVDLDAYVVGPQEWELAILKNCVPQMDAFRKGYTQYLDFPETDVVEELIGYIMQ